MKKTMLTYKTLDRFEREYKTEQYTPEQIETISSCKYAPTCKEGGENSMKKRVIATFAASDGRSAKSVQVYSREFDSYDEMQEYKQNQQFTAILYWWYLPEWMR